MKDFRDVFREKMETVPFLKSSLDASTIIWLVGTALLVLGEFILFANSFCADLFTGIGFWVMWFGIILSFLKKDENGVMIPTIAAAVTYLIIFIIYIARYHILSLSPIINVVVYGVLCFFAFQFSTLKKRMENNKAQSMTNYQNIQGGYICRNCGAVMPPEAQFCTVCGTKKASQRFCSGCGSPLKDSDVFCPSCGKKLQ